MAALLTTLGFSFSWKSESGTKPLCRDPENERGSVVTWHEL